MNSPIISVIVPVYRVEPYLRRCLDSIVNQTYRNLEIILVDDGSPDRCGEICDEYAVVDKRIIVIHQENKGLSEARNSGLDIATGSFILFIDSDDWVAINTCESALQHILEQHADMVCFGFQTVFPSGIKHIHATISPGAQDKALAMHQLVWHRWIAGDVVWNKLYSRHLFKGVRFPPGRLHEDLATMYKLIHRAHSIYLSSDLLYNYIKRDGAITSDRYRYQAHNDRMRSYYERLAFLQDQYPELVDLQLSMMLRMMLIDRYRMKGDLHEKDLEIELAHFVDQHRGRRRSMARYARLCRCYFYYRPLLPLAIRISLKKDNAVNNP